jgi:DNA mismatch repair protein MutL
MTASPRIRVLPPEVAARIAAGEVIERPVSVVRELLDNAIDAGASRITVTVEGGGLELIRVVDDGCGIPPNDVELAFERHATSKIASADDLRCVATLGFRGEALPSIAAAADVEIVTRAQGEPLGVHAVLVEGRVVRRAARAAPQGTSIAVRSLFARLPARRSFLSSPAAEGRAIAVLVSHYALAYPAIAFELEANGRRVLATAGDGVLRHAFAAVFDAETALAMLDVDHAEGGVSVSGLTSPPHVHRGTRSAISIFVNGRWVSSRSLTFAVADAYAGLLPSDRFPVATLHVRLPPDEVDVNVHPAKAEVRFRDERAVQRAIRHALAGAMDRSPAKAWSGPEAAAAGNTATTAPPLSARLRPRLELVAEPTQAPLALVPSGGAPRSQREMLPLLRVVGQMAQAYVVAEGPDGLYLVDQHAAHERVLYDRLLAGLPRDGSAVQPLLEPLLVELAAPEAAALAEHAEALAALGFDLEPFGERAWILRQVPILLGGRDLKAALHAILADLDAGRRLPTIAERAAAAVACHAAVRAGMQLSLEEMRQLLEDLERTPNPRTCPHGRPTIVHLSTTDLERQFGRR